MHHKDFIYILEIFCMILDPHMNQDHTYRRFSKSRNELQMLRFKVT